MYLRMPQGNWGNRNQIGCRSTMSPSRRTRSATRTRSHRLQGIRNIELDDALRDSQQQQPQSTYNALIDALPGKKYQFLQARAQQHPQSAAHKSHPKLMYHYPSEFRLMADFPRCIGVLERNESVADQPKMALYHLRNGDKAAHSLLAHQQQQRFVVALAKLEGKQRHWEAAHMDAFHETSKTTSCSSTCTRGSIAWRTASLMTTARCFMPRKQMGDSDEMATSQGTQHKHPDTLSLQRRTRRKHLRIARRDVRDGAPRHGPRQMLAMAASYPDARTGRGGPITRRAPSTAMKCTTRPISTKRCRSATPCAASCSRSNGESTAGSSERLKGRVPQGVRPARHHREEARGAVD